jgi:hypothetical protein
MGRTNRPRKATDYETAFSCADGYGILREEVWMDEQGVVVRYNLAFVVPHLTRVDHGRILGYDNAHGRHERHFMGKVESVAFESFPSTSRRFYREVEEMRKEL